MKIKTVTVVTLLQGDAHLDKKLLLQCPLFKNISEDTLSHILDYESYIIGNYEKGILLVQEGDRCNGVGVVLSGALSVQQISPDGDLLTISMFDVGDAFAVALCNIEHPVYPFSLRTTKKSQVVYIPFPEIKRLLKTEPTFNDNYINYLTSRVIIFQNKLKLLHYKDVRSRIMLYLYFEYLYCNQKTFKLRHSKTTISDLIGVARPSLSRELRHLVDEEIITLSGNIITLLQPELLQHYK